MDALSSSTIPSVVAARRDDLESLCRRWNVRSLELFGSAATGRFDPSRSDLDFLVEFAPAPPVERANSYFGLLFDLEALFGRSVDLVESGAISNPYFQRSVDRTRTALYATDNAEAAP